MATIGNRMKITEDFRRISMFTPVSSVFEKYGKPLFKLKDGKQYYYMGNGVFLGYLERMCKVINFERIEYGDRGEYARNILYFHKCKEFFEYLRIDPEKDGYPFEGEILGEDDLYIFDNIRINSPYGEVYRRLKEIHKDEFFQIGESRMMQNKKDFVFSHNYIMFGRYSFYFYGKGPKTKLTSFEFYFTEAT